MRTQLQPQEDCAMNLPVWSEWDLWSSVADGTVAKTTWVLCTVLVCGLSSA
jgi:hypothetical protein